MDGENFAGMFEPRQYAEWIHGEIFQPVIVVIGTANAKTRIKEINRWQHFLHPLVDIFLLGQVEPLGWDDRFDISRNNWREAFLLYERDLAIQADLEYLAEAVFVFYTKHLDKFIREKTNYGEISARES